MDKFLEVCIKDQLLSVEGCYNMLNALNELIRRICVGLNTK
jgi:hypothetical protein